jgi:hypothetical protein
MRFSGQVRPYIPPTAPLSYRLSNEVYSLDGLGACSCKNGLGDDKIALSSPLGLLALIGVGLTIYFVARKS